MSTLWIIAIGGGYLAFLAFLLFFVRPKANSQRIQVVVNTAGLPLTHEIEPTVVATLRREVRVGLLSVAAGLLLASVGMLLADVRPLGSIVFIDFTAVFVSIAVGSVIGSAIQEDARQKTDVRFARLRSVSLTDYRAPLEQWMPRAFVLIALAVFVFRVAVSPGGIGGTPTFLFVYAALMLFSLGACEVASRLLVRRGQPAGSELELAWDDALRSRALNAIALSPLYLGGYFSIASIAFYPHSRGAAAALVVELSAASEILFALGLLGWAIAWTTRKPQQRYLRRLWPELATAPVASTAASTASA